MNELKEVRREAINLEMVKKIDIKDIELDCLGMRWGGGKKT